jgi:hypothetical protein
VANLAIVSDAVAFLGDSAAGDQGAGGVLDTLLTELEALMARETGRTFLPAATGLTEVVDGTGQRFVYVSRPIATLTTIKIGNDFSQAWDSLDCTNSNVVIVDPTFPRKIDRRDGAIFWRGHGNVQVVYDSAAYLPADCKLALLEAVAFLYRRRGSEDVTAQYIFRTMNQTMRQGLDELPTWNRVVANRLKAPSIL